MDRESFCYTSLAYSCYSMCLKASWQVSAQTTAVLTTCVGIDWVSHASTGTHAKHFMALFHVYMSELASDILSLTSDEYDPNSYLKLLQNNQETH